jgi:hypothetical protein
MIDIQLQCKFSKISYFRSLKKTVPWPSGQAEVCKTFHSSSNLLGTSRGLLKCNPFVFMKYSQVIGIIASLSIIGICYMPWVFIPQLNITLSGVNVYVSKNLYLGKPIKFYLFFLCIMIIFFALPKIWVKRTNVFLGAIVLGYSIYNYLLYTLCREGVCPEKKTGIYLLVISALIVQLMTLFPKITISGEKVKG